MRTSKRWKITPKPHRYDQRPLRTVPKKQENGDRNVIIFVPDGTHPVLNTCLCTCISVLHISHYMRYSKYSKLLSVVPLVTIFLKQPCLSHAGLLGHSVVNQSFFTPFAWQMTPPPTLGAKKKKHRTEKKTHKTKISRDCPRIYGGILFICFFSSIRNDPTKRHTKKTFRHPPNPGQSHMFKFMFMLFLLPIVRANVWMTRITSDPALCWIPRLKKLATIESARGLVALTSTLVGAAMPLPWLANTYLYYI